MVNRPNDIKNIEDRINKVKAKVVSSKYKKETNNMSNSARVGLRIVIDFVSAVFVGGAMGYFLDITFNTKPFLLIFLLLCGAVAGFLNIYRFVKSIETREI